MFIQKQLTNLQCTSSKHSKQVEVKEKNCRSLHKTQSWICFIQGNLLPESAPVYSRASG